MHKSIIPLLLSENYHKNKDKDKTNTKTDTQVKLYLSCLIICCPKMFKDTKKKPQVVIIKDEDDYDEDVEYIIPKRDIKFENLVKKVPRDHVNVPGELKVGLKLKGRKGSNVTPIVVVAFDNETVTLDANHPLVGATLNVDLVVVEVREAIDAELKSGRIQDMESIYEKERIDGVTVNITPEKP